MKSVKICLLTLMAALFCCASANAEVNCKSAKVTKVGIFDAAPVADPAAASHYMVKLDCNDSPAFNGEPEKWAGEIQYMVAASDDADSMYATLLTAVSLKEPVQAVIEGDADWWSLVTTLYYIPTY